MSGLIFNEEKAKHYIRLADSSYQRHDNLYRYLHADIMAAPQHKNFPRGLEVRSLEYNRWLFFATLLNYRSVSEKVFPMAVTLWDKFPELFSSDICQMKDDLVIKALKDEDIRYTSPNQAGIRWGASARALFTHFDGDPLNIFSEVKSVDDFISLKKKLEREGNVSFLGYGPKLFSLLAIFYEELGLIDHLEGSLPVDLHIQRIFITLGIVDVVESGGEQDAMAVAEFIRPRLTKLCYELGVKPLDLSHALWFLGSNVCTKCTKITSELREWACPFAEYCPGPIDSMPYSRRGRWNFEERRLFSQNEDPRDFKLVLGESSLLLPPEKTRRVIKTPNEVYSSTEEDPRVFELFG